MKSKILKRLFAFFAIAIGLYPLMYFIVDRKFGLLSTKTPALLSNLGWNIFFYTHIILGGVALLIGWLQFYKNFRDRNLILHRRIGKLYVIAALLSSLAGIYIGAYATGGIIPQLGFICLGVLWFVTTLSSFLEIKKLRVASHEKWMVYSYALCFAAVMLRLWLPLLSILFADFFIAYKITAWICWVPNVLFARWKMKTLVTEK